MIPQPPLSEFQHLSKTYSQVTRSVYRMGTTGPGVVLMHEIPGMTPDVLRLGKMIAQQGFCVALPSLFGKDGRAPTMLRDDEEVLKMCISKEFAVFAANGSSPIVNWLRDLCRDLAAETRAPVGAVGLCITGGFALSLTVGTDGLVKAPVMSEPALPFPLLFTHNHGAIHLSVADAAAIKLKPPPCMALRFTHDSLCRAERFAAYRALLGNNLTAIEIKSPDPALGISRAAHSVLTQELRDSPGHPTWAAFERVMAFLASELKPGPPAT
jgi:dienelactone hydrolase